MQRKNKYIRLLSIAVVIACNFTSAIGCSKNADCASGETCTSVQFRLKKDGQLQDMGLCKLIGPKGMSASSCFTNDSIACGINFDGEISRERVDFIERLLSDSKFSQMKKNLMLHINSSGGSVVEAMRLGRILRKNQASVWMGRGTAVCASSCVLVLAGAPQRHYHKNVIIHRPFSGKPQEQGIEQTSAQWKSLQVAIRAYLDEMNIPRSLLDAMNSVPSNRGRELTEQELSLYLLDQDDPVFVENQDSANAARLGISRPEYMQRQRLTEKCKSDVSKKYSRNQDWEDATTWGMYYKCEEYMSNPR